jgi:hypothetical protein
LTDKPGHIIDIPDSLGRDVDRWKAGKGEAPPIDAFMSDQSLEQVASQTAQVARAVPASSLTPITKAQADGLTRFDGETMPLIPRTQRVLPDPFRRPSIEINHHGRQWLPTAVENVAAGDTVPGVGLVVKAETVRRLQPVDGWGGVVESMKVILTGKSGTPVVFDLGEQVQAHRLPD